MTTPSKPKPLSPAEVERRTRVLLESALDDKALLAQLEDLRKLRTFGGFSWLWGPILYRRNRVIFRPFILNYLSPTLWDPTIGKWGKWTVVEWKGTLGNTLENWLVEIDKADDIELFRRLYEWKYLNKKTAARFAAWRQELLSRLKAAPSAAARLTVFAKFDMWMTLDEETALALYELDAQGAAPFILKHLPYDWAWMDDKRKPWPRLAAKAKAAGDEDFYFNLYRRMTPIADWQKDALRLCGEITDAATLVAELERRHIRGYSPEIGQAFWRLVEARGRDVLPYVSRHMQQVFPRWGRKQGYGELLNLARQREWFDLWADLIRVSASDKEFCGQITDLLIDIRLGDDEIQRRLLMLTGVAREWNAPGLGIAQVRLLTDEVAVMMYERFPGLLRGPFRLGVSMTWGRNYDKLLEKLIAAADDDMIDFLASRAAGRMTYWGADKPNPTVERLADYYGAMRVADVEFSRRAANVLGQVPAYSIFSYHRLIRQNRLARLLFERSFQLYLADPASLQDLIEAPEIHVQALAYRALGMDDDRARAAAAENLDVLIGTLLRPLHRTTRLLAFGALANAGSASLEVARRIVNRAREALDLPDKRYPKEQILGLMARLMHRWPELQGERECPRIFGMEAAG